MQLRCRLLYTMNGKRSFTKRYLGYKVFEVQKTLWNINNETEMYLYKYINEVIPFLFVAWPTDAK